MKQNYITKSHRNDWIQIGAMLVLLVLFALVFKARAQEGSQGNTTIFGGQR